MSAHTDIAPVLCEDVSFTYPGDGITALDGVSLEVRQGEFVALAGMNGSGKSTLCRLLNALILPTRGKVVSCGLDTALPENLAGIRSRVGLIMQNPDNQIVGPTVEDDVAFGLENLGLPREEMLSRVQDALEAMGLSSLRRREPHLLSIGERKRLAVAGVLAMRPQVLVSDESTSMLDAPTRSETMALYRRLRDELGVVVFHATHRPEEMLAADRVLLLEGGRLMFSGSPRELFDDGELCARNGLGPPSVYLLARELERLGRALGDAPLEPKEVAERLWASC
ncbi:MAG: ATP-binding cassette domain-containing protein [Actinomycetota bacterium]|nr:ATP-binding cassette domain-containing protein [Actinomycetota bacterium]MDD5666520.1 ATP-binding cassette domain-containing protein [Actinomycetota bacterium]